MQIKILEASIKLNVDGKLVRFSKDDVATVSTEVGTTCVQFGWAEDTSGAAPTGVRKAGANGPVVSQKVSQNIA